MIATNKRKRMCARAANNSLTERGNTRRVTGVTNLQKRTPVSNASNRLMERENTRRATHVLKSKLHGSFTFFSTDV